MRKWLAVAVAVMLISAVGCARVRQAGKVKSQEDEGLILSGPESVDVKAGETETITLRLDRKGFDEEVSISIKGLPDGVTIEERSLTIPKGEIKKTYTLRAEKDAKPGK